MLSTAETEAFRRNGFVVLPGALSEPAARAREVVWESIDEDREDESTWTDRNRSEWPADMTDSEPFRELNDACAEYCRALVGDRLAYDSEAKTQIALRFPREETLTDPDAPQLSDVHSHVDGTTDVKNGEGDVVPHTINATVYLDRVQPYGGGFTAWPGSHRDVCRYLADHPIQSIAGGVPAPDGEGGWREDAMRDEVFDPLELIGPTGTVVLWHGRLEHEGGINLRPGTVRMAAIKRYFHEDAHELQEDAPDEPFRGWGGIPAED